MKAAQSSGSHPYSQPRTKLLPRAVQLEANSLYGKLKIGPHFTVSFQPIFWWTFCIHIQVEIWRERALEAHTVMMNNDCIKLSADRSVFACVTATHLCVCVGDFLHADDVSMTGLCVMHRVPGFVESHRLNFRNFCDVMLYWGGEWLQLWWAGSSFLFRGYMKWVFSAVVSLSITTKQWRKGENIKGH